MLSALSAWPLNAETPARRFHFTDEETEAQPGFEPPSGLISEASLLTPYRSTVPLEDSPGRGHRAAHRPSLGARSCLPSTHPGPGIGLSGGPLRDPRNGVPRTSFLPSLLIQGMRPSPPSIYLFAPCFVFKSAMRHQELISAYAAGEALGNAPSQPMESPGFRRGAVLFGQPCPHPPTLHTKAA